MAIKNLQIPQGAPKMSLELAPKALEFHGQFGGLAGGRVYDPEKREPSNDHLYSIPNGIMGGGLDAFETRKDYFQQLAAAAVTPEERNALLQDARNEILGLTRNGNQTAIVGDPRLAADRENHPYHAQ